MCWTEWRVGVQVPQRVTTTNIRRWVWKGVQQKKKAKTTTTGNIVQRQISYIITASPSIRMTVRLPCRQDLEENIRVRLRGKKNLQILRFQTKKLQQFSIVFNYLFLSSFSYNMTYVMQQIAEYQSEVRKFAERSKLFVIKSVSNVKFQVETDLSARHSPSSPPQFPAHRCILFRCRVNPILQYFITGRVQCLLACNIYYIYIYNPIISIVKFLPKRIVQYSFGWNVANSLIMIYVKIIFNLI